MTKGLRILILVVVASAGAFAFAVADDCEKAREDCINRSVTSRKLCDESCDRISRPDDSKTCHSNCLRAQTSRDAQCKSDWKKCSEKQ
jgi:hypothetical protein